MLQLPALHDQSLQHSDVNVRISRAYISVLQGDACDFAERFDFRRFFSDG